MTIPYLYLLTRDDDIGYDEYDSCVVCASSPEEAIKIHPSFKVGDPDTSIYIYSGGEWYMTFDDGTVDSESYNGGWTSDIVSLKVENVGTAQGAYMLGRVICSSFNAG